MPIPRTRPLARACLCALASAVLAGAAWAQPGPGVRFAVPPPGTLSSPPNVVYGIEQDARGYLWVASEQGLHRYDGVEFEAFRADPSDPRAMPGNRVTAVSVAPDGDVWAGVDRFGLVRYDADRRRFERFRFPEALARDPHVVVDAEGTVWVTGGGWGLDGDQPARVYRFDPTRRALQPIEGVQTRGWGLVLDTARRLWVLADDGVTERRDGGWRHHRLGAVAFVRGAPMRVMRGDDLLELGPRGRFRPVRASAEGEEAGEALREAARRMRRGASTVPLVDRGGRLWFASSDGGLTAVDLATGRTVDYRNDPTQAESLPEGVVSEIYEDRDGVIWVGGSQGLRTVAPGWDLYRATPLGRIQFATVLALGSSGRLWGGPACQAPSEILPDGRAVPVAEAAPAVARAIEQTAFCVSNVLEARDGTFWFAGWPFLGASPSAGVLRVGPDGVARQYRGPEAAVAELPHAATRLVHEDAAGRIWAATEGGLVRLDGDAVTVYHTTHGGLEADVIWSLADAPGGQLWVGTYGGGLSLFDPATETARTWRHDPNDAGTLPSDVITAILPSRREPGVVWVGTYDGGLVRFEAATGRMRRVDRADGLPSLTIKGLAEGAAGALWIGTDAGLVRRDAAGELRVYTEADGLPDSNVGLYDLAALPDGRIAVAVGSNLVTFDPAAVTPFRVDADVVLRALRIEGTRRALPARGAPIRLAPGERAVGVELAALSFRAPQRLRYAVRLDGPGRRRADDRWLPLGADRSAAWAGLAPGTYTLRARAGVSSGTWSRRELAIPVVVTPAWWQRRAVRGLAALLVLGLLVAAVRDLSQRRLRRRVQALEVARRLQHERERISRDLHDHVGAQLSSLLAGVELARLARERGAPEGFGDPLDAVEDDARTTMRQLRETIWALHGEAVTLPAFCDRVRADLAARCPSALATDVACQGAEGAELSPMQALNLYRIVQEAVTNALKYAGAQRLTVRLRHDGEAVTVEVSDDGRFRESAADGSGDGAVHAVADAALGGFGMRSMAARAEALGGTFEVGILDGTTVRVRVPAEPRLPASGEAPAAIPPDV